MKNQFKVTLLNTKTNEVYNISTLALSLSSALQQTQKIADNTGNSYQIVQITRKAKV